MFPDQLVGAFEKFTDRTLASFGGINGSCHCSNMMSICLGVLGELDTVDSPSIAGDVSALSL